MQSPLVVSLDAIRTDGWFERVGEGIGSFQALCDIIGARFFAFSMITGARITSLTVDRRVPDNTLVEFALGGDDLGNGAEAQRLTLAEFRRRLVNALVMEEPSGPAPTRATDLEAVQLHIGVRYLLLAPLYGYAFKELRIAAACSASPTRLRSMALRAAGLVTRSRSSRTWVRIRARNAESG